MPLTTASLALAIALLQAPAAGAPAPASSSPASDTPSAPAAAAPSGPAPAAGAPASGAPAGASPAANAPAGAAPAEDAPADEQQKLDAAVERLRAELAASRETIAALEQRVEELEAREAEQAEATEALAAEQQVVAEERAAAARSPAVRSESFGSALGSLDVALRNLIAGEGAAAAAPLEEVREPLLAARAEAGRFGATREATLASSAIQALDAAAEALARDDLWNARVALTLAAREAALANELASQGAAARPAY